MVWLKKEQKKPSENLLFIHVPRCGGTSLMKHYDVPEKSLKTKTFLKKFWMEVFFRRYALLEKSNFPVWTESNVACLFVFVIGFFLLQIRDAEYRAVAITMIIVSTFLSTFLTFVFVAPTICRIRPIRRAYLIFSHYILCRCMECIEYVTGTNKHGYLNHLTARKMLDYGYVSKEEIISVSSLAIVRNPYARMVSLYMYNRFGPAETFNHFVKSWYNNTFQPYRETREMEEWYTPCHVIPQFEYTHQNDGKDQLVRSIVKQEELKFLKHVKKDDPTVVDDSSSETSEGDRSIDDLQDPKNFTSIRDLPDAVREALMGMPHENKRRTKTPWYDYYDQETLNMTYEMYQRDFEIFNYSPKLEQRPDLTIPDVPLVETVISA
jgi:hypothetical protein